VNVNYHRVNFVVKGTVLNITASASSTVTVYYGKAGANSPPLEQFAGVVATSTLSSNAGTATITFPSGGLTLTGMAIADSGANYATVTWSVSSGATIFLYEPNVVLAGIREIFPLNLPVQTTLLVTTAGGGASDVVTIVAYYK